MRKLLDSRKIRVWSYHTAIQRWI